MANQLWQVSKDLINKICKKFKLRFKKKNNKNKPMININKALFFVAHSDDETLGCGGIIKKLISLKKTFILLIAEGSSCRFSPKGIGSKKVKIEIEKSRKKAIKAFNILGVKDYLFNNFKCGQLNTYPLVEINQVIEKVINKLRPDALFTHHHNDVNQDHNIVYKPVSFSGCYK